VAAMRKGSAAMGPYDFQPFTEGDLKYRRFQKKCLVAARDMRAGDILGPDDSKFLRVQAEQEGIAPYAFTEVALGRRLNRDVAQFEQILPHDLERG